jgi:hypothetical protein
MLPPIADQFRDIQSNDASGVTVYKLQARKWASSIGGTVLVQGFGLTVWPWHIQSYIESAARNAVGSIVKLIWACLS